VLGHPSETDLALLGKWEPKALEFVAAQVCVGCQKITCSITCVVVCIFSYVCCRMYILSPYTPLALLRKWEPKALTFVAAQMCVGCQKITRVFDCVVLCINILTR